MHYRLLKCQSNGGTDFLLVIDNHVASRWAQLDQAEYDCFFLDRWDDQREAGQDLSDYQDDLDNGRYQSVTVIREEFVGPDETEFEYKGSMWTAHIGSADDKGASKLTVRHINADDDHCAGQHLVLMATQYACNLFGVQQLMSRPSVHSGGTNSCFVEQCVKVIPDSEHNAEEWWANVRDRYPRIATLLETDLPTLLSVPDFVALSLLPGFTGGPDYAPTALMIVTEE